MVRWIGLKTLEWDRARAKLKKQFEAAGITRCEFGYNGCWRDNGLSFAHIDKRRYLRPNELYIVALACIVCHNELERMPRRVMRETIMAVITKRKTIVGDSD